MFPSFCRLLWKRLKKHQVKPSVRKRQTTFLPRREWQTTSAFLPWEPHEQYEKAKRYGHKESDTTETLNKNKERGFQCDIDVFVPCLGATMLLRLWISFLLWTPPIALSIQPFFPVGLLVSERLAHPQQHSAARALAALTGDSESGNKAKDLYPPLLQMSADCHMNTGNTTVSYYSPISSLQFHLWGSRGNFVRGRSQVHIPMSCHSLSLWMSWHPAVAAAVTPWSLEYS